jgi:hypothetical protein
LTNHSNPPIIDTIIPALPLPYAAAVTKAHIALTTAETTIAIIYFLGTGTHSVKTTIIIEIVAGIAANNTVKFNIQPIQHDTTAAIVYGLS